MNRHCPRIQLFFVYQIYFVFGSCQISQKALIVIFTISKFTDQFGRYLDLTFICKKVSKTLLNKNYIPLKQLGSDSRDVFHRPVVAGAVLQPSPAFNNYLIHSVRQLRIFIPHYVSCVMCHVVLQV